MDLSAARVVELGAAVLLEAAGRGNQAHCCVVRDPAGAVRAALHREREKSCQRR